MFIRKVKKKRSKNSKTFYQYQLVQSVRIEGKSRQKSILYLGSDPLLANKENRADVLAVLKAKIFNQPDLFSSEIAEDLKKLALSYYEKYKIRYGLNKEENGDRKSTRLNSSHV